MAREETETEGRRETEDPERGRDAPDDHPPDAPPPPRPDPQPDGDPREPDGDPDEAEERYPGDATTGSEGGGSPDRVPEG